MNQRAHAVDRRRLLLWLGVPVLAASVFLVARAVDPEALRHTWRAALSSPAAVAAVLGLYGLAFVLRSWVWTKLLPRLSFGHALAAVHVSLAGNHVLPFRLGEALRVTSVVRRERVSLPSATATTVVLRAADILAVLGLAAVLGPGLVAGLVGAWAWALLVPAGALWAAGIWWLRRLDEQRRLRLGPRVALVAAGAALAWALESAVMWQAARWAGIDIDATEAIVVTAVTIAAQIVAVAPAGLGTYEAAATASLIALGVPAGPALAAALAAHALKTAYALVSGAVAVFVPSPTAFGRLRLPRPAHGRPPRVSAVKPDDPIVLFLPAHDEEESVGRVVERAPAMVGTHPVVVIVIDDGSTDATAHSARAAGAEVVSFERNRGLGAAVRAGLAGGVERRAAAIAFCDADGEYSPEELTDLVTPILEGDADYVVGSRFAGSARRMRPHRMLGNILLTGLLRIVARRTITDGQSGYRAFSLPAAEDAEVIHDFNYAQVLTLDLLAKGYRYREVPISYRFRQTGRSFIRLGTYLRKVIPAVYREINTA